MDTIERLQMIDSISMLRSIQATELHQPSPNGIQSYMASPKEGNQARQMLLGKNLMPYLNKSDTRTVNNAYKHWHGNKKKKLVENKKFVKEGAT
jgi:hypothetical protein